VGSSGKKNAGGNIFKNIIVIKNMTNKKLKIGFIGQGWIGKNYADDFEERKYDIVRYDRSTYPENKDQIKECDVVFIAVPTPTTPKGFDYSIVENVLSLIGKGKIAVIKSTILPGTTEKLQKKYKNIFVFHSPEFLMEKTAAYEARHPERNIVGVPKMDKKNIEAAKKVLSVLPKAPFEKIMYVKEAEMVKYIGNNFLYTKVVFFNIMFDFIKKQKLNYENIREAVSFDPRIGGSHTTVVHNSGHTRKAGRGAGGHCFIKDMEALCEGYDKVLGKDFGYKVLESLKNKNYDLLVNSKKDLELLTNVIGEKKLKSYRK
jgi:nucleotide sugar dehydrogenase